MMNKKDLSETDICAKYITPAVIQAGWDEATQIRREVGFTKGRIIVRGKVSTLLALGANLTHHGQDIAARAPGGTPPRRAAATRLPHP